jgi:hypothetical protein
LKLYFFPKMMSPWMCFFLVVLVWQPREANRTLLPLFCCSF